MGYSMCALLTELMDARPLRVLGTVAYPTAFAYAATAWEIAPSDALTGFFWSWIENQVMAALKAVPLGQTDGQRMLLALARRAQGAAACAKELDDESIGAITPQLALLSARHESQYSRLFRS